MTGGGPDGGGGEARVERTDNKTLGRISSKNHLHKKIVHIHILLDVNAVGGGSPSSAPSSLWSPSSACVSPSSASPRCSFSSLDPSPSSSSLSPPSGLPPPGRTWIQDSAFGKRFAVDPKEQFSPVRHSRPFDIHEVGVHVREVRKSAWKDVSVDVASTSRKSAWKDVKGTFGMILMDDIVRPRALVVSPDATVPIRPYTTTQHNVCRTVLMRAVGKKKSVLSTTLRGGSC